MLFAPFILLAFFGSQVLLAGQGVQEAAAVVERSLWPALKLNWVFWPAAQLVNFRFVPLQQRVGYVSLCLVFWNAVLSYVHNRNEAKLLQDQQQQPTK